MEQVYGIRHLVLAEGWTIRRVAREFKVSRNTVRRYLAGAEPGVRKPAARARPVLAGVRERIEALLAARPRGRRANSGSRRRSCTGCWWPKATPSARRW